MRGLTELQYAAQRISNSTDFKLVIGHLTNEQASVVLNMNATSEHLVHAKIYFDALHALPDLIKELSRESE